MEPDDLEYLKELAYLAIPLGIFILEYYIGKLDNKANSTIAVIINLLKKIAR